MKSVRGSTAAFSVLCVMAAGCAHYGISPPPEAAPGAVERGTGGADDGGTGLTQTTPPAAEAIPGTPPTPPAGEAGPAVWGLVGTRVYPYGERTGPNGVEYDQLFALDLDLNLWLWRGQGLYLFAESEFWGQKPGAGITNPSQGAFDFSKREFDFDVGAAWNYYGPLEARAFAYSFNNLNRGTSLARPAGFNDGVGLENRYYLGGAYAELGTPEFDVARAPFVSVGYYPTKEMVDTDGVMFRPGPFVRAYLTLDLYADRLYLFEGAEFIGRWDFRAELLRSDAGVAARPFARAPRLEFRVGVENVWDLLSRDLQTSFYGGGRFIF